MGGWRTKLIFLLIVYFAGFASAIYCLAPAPENTSAAASETGFNLSALKSDEFAKDFNSGMHKCLGFTKDAAIKTGDYLKEKFKEMDKDS